MTALDIRCRHCGDPIRFGNATVALVWRHITDDGDRITCMVYDEPTELTWFPGTMAEPPADWNICIMEEATGVRVPIGIKSWDERQ